MSEKTGGAADRRRWNYAAEFDRNGDGCAAFLWRADYGRWCSAVGSSVFPDISDSWTPSENSAG